MGLLELKETWVGGLWVILVLLLPQCNGSCELAIE
jgi:hypothetical protein